MLVAERIISKEAKFPRLKRVWKRVKAPLAAISVSGLLLFLADDKVGDKLIRGFCTELGDYVESYYEQYCVTGLGKEPNPLYTTEHKQWVNFTVTRDGKTLLYQSDADVKISTFSKDFPVIKMASKDFMNPDFIFRYNELYFLYRDVKKYMRMFIGEHDFIPNYCFSPDGQKLAISISENGTVGIFDIQSKRLLDTVDMGNFFRVVYNDAFMWFDNNTLIGANDFEVTRKNGTIGLGTYVFGHEIGRKNFKIFESDKTAISSLEQSPCGTKFLLTVRDSMLGWNNYVCDLSGIISRVPTNYPRLGPNRRGTPFDESGKGIFYVKEKVAFQRQILPPVQCVRILGINYFFKETGNLNDWRPRFKVDRIQVGVLEGYELFYKGIGATDRELKIADLMHASTWSVCKGGILITKEYLGDDPDVYTTKYSKIDFDPSKEY